jgi:nucleoid-associated protein YgaU
LRVSAVSLPTTSIEHADGRFQGANKKWYYAVTDDAINGNAANLYVLLSEVTILRSGFLYTVKAGDSLSKIAREYDSQIPGLAQKIYKHNKEVIGPNPNMIHPGQELYIPNR